MLLFYCAPDATLDAIHRHGIQPDGEDGLLLWTSLEAAQAACEGSVLVVDATVLTGNGFPALSGEGNDRMRVETVPPDAVCNLDPYRVPHAVAAGGGYVARWGEQDLEVLLIFRRGVWDLPKGKQDADETLEACALREVREEIGITTLRLVRELGTTLHGYEREGRYDVKTTHWYLMQTPETAFTPQAKEGIEAVTWMPWHEAVETIGYASLRWHMQHVEGLVRAALEEDSIHR